MFPIKYTSEIKSLLFSVPETAFGKDAGEMEGYFFSSRKKACHYKCAPFWCTYFCFSLLKIPVGDKDEERE